MSSVTLAPAAVSRPAVNSWLVATAVVIPTFMEILDTTIATASMRYIAGGLSATMNRAGFKLGRLKTGTPPRLDGRTIDWASLERQAADENPVPFSLLTDRIENPQIHCGITRTTNAPPANTPTSSGGALSGSIALQTCAPRRMRNRHPGSPERLAPPATTSRG